MRILVMGAGGIGGALGGLLAERGHEVSLVARGAHLAALRERGLTIRWGERTLRLPQIRAAALPIEAGPQFDLIIFTVKTYDTAEAAAALAPVVGPGTTVLPLQNGVESVERLGAVLGAEPLLAGTAVFKGEVVEPGVIEIGSAAVGVTVAEPSGEVTERLEAVAAVLRDAGVQVAIYRDARLAVWEKFIGLVAMATLASACEVERAAIWRTPETTELFHALLDETAAVGRALGVPLSEQSVQRAADLHQLVSATSKPSMQLDFERRRRVELEATAGTVIRLGRQLGVATPALSALYAVLKVRALEFGGLTP